MPNTKQGKGLGKILKSIHHKLQEIKPATKLLNYLEKHPGVETLATTIPSAKL